MIRQGRSRTGFRVQVERGAAENVGGPLSRGHAGHRESANGLNRPIVIVSNQPPNLMQMIQFLNFAGRKKSVDRSAGGFVISLGDKSSRFKSATQSTNPDPTERIPWWDAKMV